MGLTDEKIALDRDEAIRLHRMLWKKMAERVKSTGKFPSKTDVIYEMGYRYNQLNASCFLCTYAKRQARLDAVDADKPVRKTFDPHNSCNWCPLEWGNCGTTPCLADNTPYDRFDGLSDDFEDEELSNELIEQVAQLCEDIAELPVAEIINN